MDLRPSVDFAPPPDGRTDPVPSLSLQQPCSGSEPQGTRIRTVQGSRPREGGILSPHESRNELIRRRRSHRHQAPVEQVLQWAVGWAGLLGDSDAGNLDGGAAAHAIPAGHPSATCPRPRSRGHALVGEQPAVWARSGPAPADEASHAGRRMVKNSRLHHADYLWAFSSLHSSPRVQAHYRHHATSATGTHKHSGTCPTACPGKFHTSKSEFSSMKNMPSSHP